MPEVLAGNFHRVGVQMEALEGNGQGADAAFDARRQQFGQQIKKEVGVSQPFRRSPVRQVNLFLHPDAVKLAVGKTVHRENVTILLREPALKGQQRAGFAQLARRPVAQAQADGKRFLGTDPFADRQRVVLQRFKRLAPGFAAMDVGAISEVEPVI